MWSAWIDGSFRQDYDKCHVGIGGYIITNNGNKGVLMKFSEHFEVDCFKGSSNLAEYSALNYLLKYLIENKIDEAIVIRTDCKIMANQMNGLAKIRKGLYLKEARQATTYMTQLKNVIVKFTSRKNNKKADKLSKCY